MERDGYTKKSAFQAVYLVAFLVAILFTSVTALDRTTDIASKLAGTKTANANVIEIFLSVLVAVLVVHWIRLYITMEQLEDELASERSKWFLGWKTIARFWEFIARCAIVAWMGLKAVEAHELDELVPFFRFLAVLYLLMCFWGFVYIAGEITKNPTPQGGQQRRTIKEWARFVGLEAYLVLSIPAAGGLWLIASNVEDSRNDNYLVLITSCIFAILGLGYHLWWDFVEPINPKEGSRSWRKSRGNQYVHWILSRVEKDELQFVIFFSLSLWLLIALGGDSKFTIRALPPISFVGAIIMGCCSISALFTPAKDRRYVKLTTVGVSMMGALLALLIFLSTRHSHMVAVETRWLLCVVVLAFLCFLAEFFSSRRTPVAPLAQQAPQPMAQSESSKRRRRKSAT